MNKIIFRRPSKRLSVLGIVVLLLITVVQVVSATTTPQVCDDDVKYYCSKVTYVSDSGGWKITDRLYKGGRDGGAVSWYLYWIKDMQKINGNWTVSETFGPGPLHYNIPLSGWYTYGADRVRVNYSMVQFRIRFTECVGGDCWDWCSQYLQHQLWNNLSGKFGTGVCD